jgi:mevalonate pyrophosphate decarboxylase
MGDLDSRCEKCEREIERLRGELDGLRSEMIEVVKGVLVRADEVLVEVETFNRQMFADLRAQTDAGFASLRACIDAVSRAERKDDEPPRLN